MDQERLFATLGKQKKATLFDLLQDALYVKPRQELLNSTQSYSAR
jgi:hypothetical protein